MSIALALHVLAVTVWVGGMFFAYMILRPVAASQLQPPNAYPFGSMFLAVSFLGFG